MGSWGYDRIEDLTDRLVDKPFLAHCSRSVISGWLIESNRGYIKPEWGSLAVVLYERCLKHQKHFYKPVGITPKQLGDLLLSKVRGGDFPFRSEVTREDFDKVQCDNSAEWERKVDKAANVIQQAYARRACIWEGYHPADIESAEDGKLGPMEVFEELTRHGKSGDFSTDCNWSARAAYRLWVTCVLCKKVREPFKVEGNSYTKHIDDLFRIGLLRHHHSERQHCVYRLCSKCADHAWLIGSRHKAYTADRLMVALVKYAASNRKRLFFAA
jgi:hypothetical protein